MTFDLDVAYPGMGIPAFWKSLFPNWPDELINKFSAGIAIDAPKFGFAGGADISGFQNWWGAVVSAAAQGNYTKNLDLNTEQNFGFNLLGPQNPRYATTARWDISFWYATQYSVGWFGGGAPVSIQTNMNQNMHYENLQWVNLHVFMGYDTRLFQNNFQWNYATQGNLVGYHDTWNGMWPDKFADYSSYLIVAPNASATPYQFVDTILALHENQADNAGINYGLLYEYQTFRDAYLKYAQQIDSNTQLVKSQSQAAVNAYRQDYNDRAQREKNDLASKKLQILQAIDNQKQTTLQNYQTQLLTAQNLKLTLNQVLHNG